MRWTNSFLLTLALLLVSLLLGGAGTEAAGWRRFPARGSFYTLTYPTGQRQKVHAWCTGERNSSLPTFWIEVGGGGHSMSDLWGLQFALNDLGRRVCTYDWPGCAWSDYEVPNQPYVTEQLIAAMGEPGPFILLGTMDDGPERAYRYALDHPENVKGIVIMGYTEPELVTYQRFMNISAAAAQDYGLSQVKSRLALGDVIRGIAIQWGIMAALLPSSPDAPYVPASMDYESHFLNILNEKQWNTQCQYLAAQVREPSTLIQPDLWTSNTSLSSSIPVVAFVNNATISEQCAQAGYSPSSQECQLLGFTQQRAFQFNEAITSLTPGSQLFFCQDCQNLIGQGNTIPLVVQNVMASLGNITL